LIVGTQTDLRDDANVRDKLAKQKTQPVRKEDGDRMAKELGAVKYVECSALTQYKLKDVFDEVCHIPTHPHNILYLCFIIKLTSCDIGHRRGIGACSQKEVQMSLALVCHYLYPELEASVF
jgi:hypothetical protein